VADRFVGAVHRVEAHQADVRQPRAEASAYSLHDYAIADELGGWAPSTTSGNDAGAGASGWPATWCRTTPPWTANGSASIPTGSSQLDHCPFPGYRFDGPDLSRDPRVEIKLEDHYYDRSDAAVVFRHVDKGNGRHRYIYHGNDGTSMPWNDTANSTTSTPPPGKPSSR